MEDPNAIPLSLGRITYMLALNELAVMQSVDSPYKLDAQFVSHQVTCSS